tara:strand:- start:118 stop:288 length:171 start_codon:yes stop_codon:yes gene_type:complete
VVAVVVMVVQELQHQLQLHLLQELVVVAVVLEQTKDIRVQQLEQEEPVVEVLELIL